MIRGIKRALVADALAIALAFAVAFVAKFLEPPGTRAQLPYAMLISGFIALIWVACLWLAGAYRWSTVANGVTDTGIVVRASVLAFLVTGTLSFLLKTEFSRVFVVLAFPVGVVLLSLGRRWVRQSMHREFATGRFQRTALLVTHNGHGAEVSDLLTLSQEVPVTSVVELSVTSGTLNRENIKEILVKAAENGCELVVVGQGLTSDNTMIAELSWQLDQFHVELLVVPGLLGDWTSRLNLKRHRSLPLLQLEEPRLSEVQRMQKRALDLMIAVPVFILLQPVYLLIALGVRLTTIGPTFYTQPRVGAEGRAFPFYKFRSMRVGADAERLATLGRPDDEMVDRYRRDPRITPFGRFIRRWSLDELPQLWNVIIGQMSVVGPRPMLFEELPQLADAHHRRHLIKPGLTGLWQISGRKETTWDERMMLDLYYINSWSIGVDIAIIVKTFRVIISGQGSY